MSVSKAIFGNIYSRHLLIIRRRRRTTTIPTAVLSVSIATTTTIYYYYHYYYNNYYYYILCERLFWFVLFFNFFLTGFALFLFFLNRLTLNEIESMRKSDHCYADSWIYMYMYDSTSLVLFLAAYCLQYVIKSCTDKINPKLSRNETDQYQLIFKKKNRP